MAAAAADSFVTSGETRQFRNADRAETLRASEGK